MNLVYPGGLEKNMETLKYIIEKYNLPETGRIEIPNVGRKDLALLFHELDFKTGVEIGVQQGIYSEILCQSNPQAKIYGVDKWEWYPTFAHYITSNTQLANYGRTKTRMAQYPNYKIIRGWSMDALKKFKDESLDFVFIDGNHDYDFLINDLIGWSKKVRKGGIISGHDYRRSANSKINSILARWDVKIIIDLYVKIREIDPLFIWGLRDSPPGVYRDKERSWMWVKS